MVPSHTPPAAQTPRRRLELGSLGAQQAQALPFCGGTALGEDCLVEEGWGSDSTLDSPPLASATVSCRLPASTLSPPLFSPRVLRVLF